MQSASSVKSTSRRWPKIIMIAAIVSIVLIAVAAASAFAWYTVSLAPVDPASSQRELVVIQKGLGADDIARLLEEKQIIKSSTAFGWYTSRKGVKDKLQAGTYELSPSLSTAEVVDKLVSGDVARRTVTFVPGRRLDQLRAAMIEAGFDEAAVDEALDSVGRKTLAGILPDGASLEGYLYPETYLLPLEGKPDVLIAQATAEFLEHLTPDVKEGIKAQGLSIHRAVILASIIQQESSNPEVQKQIAQVFLRRLEIGMKLQADPTFRYGAALTGKTANSSLDHPYNTYKIAALPPGPIGNVGKSALQAVASPSEGDYLFFVSGDDGKTYFSRTLQEHEALKAQHCIELCKL